MPHPDPHPEFLSGWVCYRSVPAVANDLILVELDGGPCSSFYPSRFSNAVISLLFPFKSCLTISGRIFCKRLQKSDFSRKLRVLNLTFPPLNFGSSLQHKHL